MIITRDRNWWPKEIFGDAAGDLRRQRVFLHLDLDLDPNALKKDFMWDHYSKEQLIKEIVKETKITSKKLRNTQANSRVVQVQYPQVSAHFRILRLKTSWRTSNK